MAYPFIDGDLNFLNTKLNKRLDWSINDESLPGEELHERSAQEVSSSQACWQGTGTVFIWSCKQNWT